MIRLTMALGLLALFFLVQAADEPAYSLADGDHAETAQWMSAQADPRMQAAGLLTLASWPQAVDGFDSQQFLSQVDAVLEKDPTPGAVFMLANACRQMDEIDACRSAGVLDAVNRLDGGNPLAAGQFHEEDSEGWRDMLVAAEHVDQHFGDLVSAWYQAHRMHKPAGLAEGDELVAAVAIAQATAPSLQPLAARCRAAVDTDEALDAACQRLSRQMRESGATLLLRTLGYDMARSRALARDEEAEAERLQREKEEAAEIARCLAQHAEGALSGNSEMQDLFVEELQTNGELAAFRAVATKLDDTPDCGDKAR